MRLLIDHDIILYRGLFGCKEGYYRQLQTCEYMIERIIDRLGSDDITLFLSDSRNFRNEISADYKANRTTSVRPPYLHDARLYFRKYWDAVLTDNCEADDAIGMAHDDESIVVSNDKDMFQLGGFIYNPVKDEMFDIQNPEYFFYLQMLVGDHADNVEGLRNPEKAHHKNPPKFTDATAQTYLAEKSMEEMRQIVQDLYFAQYGDGWFEKYDMTARLLFLRRADTDNYYDRF